MASMERFENIFKGIGFHVAAHAAAADERLVRELALEARAESAFREEQKRRVRGGVLDVFDHLTGASDVVGEERDSGVAFRVAHDAEPGILLAEETDEVRVVCFVDVAAPRVEYDFFFYAAAVEFGLQIFAHESVRDEYNFVVRKASYDFEDIGTGDAYVAFRFDVRGGIDVADEGVLRIFFAERTDFIARDAVGEGTAGKRSGDENFFAGVEDLRRFAHEAHRREDDYVRLNFRRVLAQLETVSVEVGDGHHDFRGHVSVGEDDGIALFFKALNLIDRFDHLFAFFEAVAAEDGPWLDCSETVVKFLCVHSPNLQRSAPGDGGASENFCACFCYLMMLRLVFPESVRMRRMYIPGGRSLPKAISLGICVPEKCRRAFPLKL